MLYGIVDVNFFFFRHDFVRPISLELLLAETPNWVCCLVLQSSCALLLTIQFAFFFFFAKILSGPYLWNRYSETPNWACCLVLRFSCTLLLTIQFVLLFLFIFFFCHNFVRAISLEPLLAETTNWVCCLVLRSNFALLLTIQFASLFIYFFFSPRFCLVLSFSSWGDRSSVAYRVTENLSFLSLPHAETRHFFLFTYWEMERLYDDKPPQFPAIF